MFKPTPAVVTALHDLIHCLAAVECVEAAGLELRLSGELNRKKPDLTSVLLGVATSALAHDLALGRVLTAAACRAACAVLGERHPGPTIEVRVPPFAAVQLGFGTGPSHTRGTPPNVAEFTPEAFLRLATGLRTWAAVNDGVTTSGAHVDDVAQAFPVTPIR